MTGMKTTKIWFSRILVLTGILIALVACSKSSPMPNYSPSPVVPPASSNEVYIQNMAFSPSSITVNVGTTVKWTNKDNMLHSVTSNTSVFDSGDMNLNSTYSYTFTTVGIYSYHCKFHPEMTGIVTVK
jgi:plastocyanin